MLKDETKRDFTILGHPRVILFVSFCLSLIVGALIVIKIEKYNIIIARAEASNVVSNYGSSLERVINNNLSVTYSLGMLIHEGEEGKIGKLEEFGEQILHIYPNVSNISLAPNGIVKDIIPLEGNEGAVGHDLFKDKNRATEAQDTKDSGLLTVAGPFNLIQGGGSSIIGRLPIFIPDEGGREEFWGFTSVAMSIEAILNEVEIETLEEMGYEYELWRQHPDTDEKEMIASSKSDVIEAEEQKVILPNGEWILGISPIGGWSHKRQFFANSTTTVTFSTLIALLFWMIAKLRISKRSLEKIAFFDGLTGLPNRRVFFHRLQQAMEDSKRDGSLLAVCYLDLDDFKDTNDSLGHKAGDLVLIEVSKRYKSIMGVTDTVCRLGGDEFAILLPGLSNKEECIAILERLQGSLMEPIIFEGHSIMASTSMGVTLFPCENSGEDDLLKYADFALYQAKQDGKGKYKFYTYET